MQSAQPQEVTDGVDQLAGRSPSEQDRVLLIGGAGYVGSVVTDHLLREGYRVRSLDLLLYDNDVAVVPYLLDDHYEFIRGDYTDRDDAARALEDVDHVVILGGLVGDPITQKYPDVSQAVNETGMSRLFDELERHALARVVFISTCSNYGKIAEDEAADEDHELRPLSLYAEAKVDRERDLMDREGEVDYSACVLRFATAFGVSPRMRFDLTVNHFTRDMYLGEELLVYDAETWRPYCHVRDFARAIRQVLEVPRRQVNFEVFNVGSDENNCTKQMIVDKIRAHFPDAPVRYEEHGDDPRDYRVDFGKIRDRLGFAPEYSVDDGIEEVASALEKGLFDNVGARPNLYGNYEVEYPARATRT